MQSMDIKYKSKLRVISKETNVLQICANTKQQREIEEAKDIINDLKQMKLSKQKTRKVILNPIISKSKQTKKLITESWSSSSEIIPVKAENYR